MYMYTFYTQLAIVNLVYVMYIALSLCLCPPPLSLSLSLSLSHCNVHCNVFAECAHL